MSRYSLAHGVSRQWWILLLRGMLALLLAALAFFFPGPTLLTVIMLFGVYAILDGAVALWAAFRWRSWWLGMLGVIGVVAGLIALFSPELAALAMVFVIASWALVRGILEISFAIRLRREISNEWLLILGGVISIALGLTFFMLPAAGAVALIWLMAAYAAVFGVIMISLALRLRRLSSAQS